MWSSICGYHGCTLGVPWAYLERTLGVPGRSLGYIGRLWASLGVLGRSLASLGVIGPYQTFLREDLPTQCMAKPAFELLDIPLLTLVRTPCPAVYNTYSIPFTRESNNNNNSLSVTPGDIIIGNYVTLNGSSHAIEVIVTTNLYPFHLAS
jgi:hypothetical protein